MLMRLRLLLAFAVFVSDFRVSLVMPSVELGVAGADLMSDSAVHTAQPLVHVCHEAQCVYRHGLYLSVSLSICMSVCLSACLPACLSVCLPVCLSIYLSICLSVCCFVQG